MPVGTSIQDPMHLARTTSCTFTIGRRISGNIWATAMDLAPSTLLCGAHLMGCMCLEERHLGGPRMISLSWQNIFPGTLPEARSKHTAVWSPEVNGMFVFGGFGTSALNDLHFYGALGAASTPSAVVGDPITWYKGKKVKFWFPPDELLLILKTPELKLWASTFTGPSIDFQWFGRFVVTTVEGLEMVAVQVRRGAVKQNTSDFEELVVTMGGRPLRGRGSRLYAGANGTHVAVGVRSLRHLASNGNWSL